MRNHFFTILFYTARHLVNYLASRGPHKYRTRCKCEVLKVQTDKLLCYLKNYALSETAKNTFGKGENLGE